ncbi:Polcalcin Jun o 2 (Calcium-binding pollen allergen Jun o 2) (allergen Jun o 2) [Durusdinium trenchii]|uniref:Polcalcin Jun o 2 (Calcium-binding pollen allergen Jun o 2) (Allergen Jun o 2) n=1 Tax=Durusdinium trenchii TaxID=1381693 RepID=A0ABP0K879_9DINO
MAARQRLQELFEKYDTSGDGTLSEEEMAKVFQALNIKKEKVEAMFKAADSDQDGVIQVHEFISWLTARGVSIKILKEREARKRKRAKHSEFAL